MQSFKISSYSEGDRIQKKVTLMTRSEVVVLPFNLGKVSTEEVEEEEDEKDT